MMNLLKYDWKRNSTLLLSTFAVLIIVQAALTIVGETRDWDKQMVIALSILGYTAVAVLIFVNSCRAFDHNINSFSRRLLPLHPLKGVGAVVLLSLLVAIAFVAVAVIHILLYVAFMGMNISELLGGITFNSLTVIKLVAVSIWAYSSILIVIMAATTVTRCFRSKHAIWIGIIFFFATISLISWLENVLFERSEGAFSGVSVENEINNDSISFSSTLDLDIPLGPILLEMVGVGALLYLITYLLNKKMEL
ncbi:hypothetical protein [Brevibacillus reuszeri]|uniref:hypothetical protein n=1 Tax=Brevibacillus reuszeri TaxID=54915 RepID=UPI0028990371|nr:hypothetical protein [Brevibacillus reuszeri]